MIINRVLSEQIEESLFKDKVILIFGARRTGKTTLLSELYKKYEKLGKKCKFWNCERLRIKYLLDAKHFGELTLSLQNCDMLFLDEAQTVQDIGRSLKLIHDEIPYVQVIATGSSSFDLANKTGEPLVGRSRTFELYPFSVSEIINSMSDETFFSELHFDKILRFGTYPAIWNLTERDKRKELENLVTGNLYKDILSFEHLKSPEKLLLLLQKLALQLGSEVSYKEIAQTIAMSVPTVQRYIELLEKCYIIFKLPPLTKNLRNELGYNRSRKIYFYDIGIRNALIDNFQPILLRSDIGAIWENFCIIELMKKAQKEDLPYKHFFWRNYQKQEIDYIQKISTDAQILAYEFKYNNNRRVKLPKLFKETYNPLTFKVIHKDNFLKELTYPNLP